MPSFCKKVYRAMRFSYAWIILLLLPFRVPGQTTINSLEALLQYADAHGATAKQAKLQPAIARQDVKLAASGLYPRINAFASGDYYPVIPVQVIPAEILGGQAGTYYKAQFGLPYVFAAGAEVSMPVVNFEKWAQLAQARAQYEQARWSSKAAIENYHIQLIQAYYQWLVTKEILKLSDENVTITNELMRIVEARNKAGVLNPADYNRSRNLQISAGTDRINYQKVAGQHIHAITALLADNDTFTFSEDITAFSWPEPAGRNASDRAAWQEADAKVALASQALSQARRGGLPRLALNGRYAYNMQSRFEAGNPDVEFSVANAGLRLDFPLFQGGYYRSLQTKSRLQLDAAKYERERTQAILTQQQQDWEMLYRAARDKYLAIREKVAGSADNMRIARLNMEEGLMEFDEFSNIFMEYNRARMEQLQNLADGILYYLLSTQNF